jgi:hypothetical protein
MTLPVRVLLGVYRWSPTLTGRAAPSEFAPTSSMTANGTGAPGGRPLRVLR